jgi:hypothetical protein
MTSYTGMQGIDVSNGVNQDGAQDLKFKFNIGTEELREIIAILNRKPFELNFTLVFGG